MKKLIFYILFFLFNYFPAECQDVINNSGLQINLNMLQLSNPGIDNVLGFQMLNQGIDNSVTSFQIGNYNVLSINQEKDNSIGSSNQSFTHQIGNSNELSLNQKGSGNLLVNYQVGNTSETEKMLKNELSDIKKSSFPAFEINSALATGEANKMDIAQSGNSNIILAIQEGSNNSFSGEQKGQNNNLYLLQKGMNNNVSGFVQANESESILYDKVIQIGDNLNLNTTGSSIDRKSGNTYIQTGTNLSFQLTNTQFNPAGGVEVTMTGNNMKIIIDQTSVPYQLK